MGDVSNLLNAVYSRHSLGVWILSELARMKTLESLKFKYGENIYRFRESMSLTAGEMVA
jgi:hypothetical protein